MRFDDFHRDSRKQLAQRLEITEEQLDEILPAIGAIGAGIARAGAGAAKAAAKGAGALAKGTAKAAARGAKGLGRAAARGAQNAARQSMIDQGAATKKTNEPTTSVGSQSTQGTQDAQADLIKKLKPGKVLDIPSMSKSGKPGPTKKFKVTRNVKGEVELQNPMPKPGEPKKFVYNQDELAGVVDANK